jgi:hypothetical protein
MPMCFLIYLGRVDDIARGTDLLVEKVKNLKPLAPDNAIQISQ